MQWVTEQVGDCRAQICQIFKVSWEQNTPRYQNDTHRHEDIPTHSAMCRKDYITVIGRLLPSNPLLEKSVIKKVGTDIAYSEEVCAFVDPIPELGQNSIKNLLIHGFSDANKLFSDFTVTKNNFVNFYQVNSKSRLKENAYP